jgi:hypothetical protein
MAMDGGSAGATDVLVPDSDFLILPLNLRTQLARFGIGSDDLIVIDGMPDDAALTSGAKKPDGSWSLREIDLDACSFMPLYGNGETHTLRACVLTPDPSDHGLAKTKGKADIIIEVPLTPLPILEAFDDPVLPPPASGATSDTVIPLPADPKLKASEPVPAPPSRPAPSPGPTISLASSAASEPSPAPPANPTIAAQPGPAASRSSFDQRLAQLRADWKANVARQVAAAEQRLKANHLAQLGKIQGTPAQDEAPRGTVGTPEASSDLRAVEERLAEARRRWQAEHEAALAQARESWRSEEAARIAAAEAEWRAEAMQQRIALEARMAETYQERLAAMEAVLAAKTAPAPAAAPVPEDWSARLERALADAQVGWEVDEAERRSKLEADLAAAHERHVAQIEAQQAALYEMRLAAAEAAWRKAEAERLVAAEAVWSVEEAERLAASEARWRAEHDKRLEAVLASLGTMVKGQLGAIAGAPLPLPDDSPATPPAPAPQPQQLEDRTAAASDPAADPAWRETAAA